MVLLFHFFRPFRPYFFEANAIWMLTSTAESMGFFFRHFTRMAVFFLRRLSKANGSSSVGQNTLLWLARPPGKSARALSFISRPGSPGENGYYYLQLPWDIIITMSHGLTPNQTNKISVPINWKRTRRSLYGLVWLIFFYPFVHLRLAVRAGRVVSVPLWSLRFTTIWRRCYQGIKSLLIAFGTQTKPAFPPYWSRRNSSPKRTEESSANRLQ